jgi:SsrA-binding protein
MALADHPRASYDYEILETYEAGIELLGFEVKAIRKGQASLRGAHVVVRGGEAYLVGANIPPYQAHNTPADYDPTRARRLLLNKKELRTLLGKEEQKGLTLIPLSLYNKSQVIKVKIAVARGKKRADKREVIKAREAGREAQRTLKNESSA